MTQIIVSFCEILIDGVDVESSDASFEVFLLADDFLVESRRVLRQTTNEEHVGDKELLGNFHFGLTNGDAWILSIPMNTQCRDMISAFDRYVMPQAIVHFHRQNNFFSLTTSYNESNVAVA